jgi:hypothetical protein
MVVDLRTNEGQTLLDPKIDPGFALAVCPHSIEGVPAASILDLTTMDPRMQSPVEKLSRKYLICANSEYGAAVIGLRKWYCDADVECLKSEWVADRPKWGSKLDESFYTYSINGLTITQFDASTKPGLRPGAGPTKADSTGPCNFKAPDYSALYECLKARERAKEK